MNRKKLFLIIFCVFLLALAIFIYYEETKPTRLEKLAKKIENTGDYLLLPEVSEECLQKKDMDSIMSYIPGDVILKFHNTSTRKDVNRVLTSIGHKEKFKDITNYIDTIIVWREHWGFLGDEKIYEISQDIQNEMKYLGNFLENNNQYVSSVNNSYIYYDEDIKNEKILSRRPSLLVRFKKESLKDDNLESLLFNYNFIALKKTYLDFFESDELLKVKPGIEYIWICHLESFDSVYGAFVNHILRF